MSSPMYDIPVHCPIGINKNGDGPVDRDDPSYWMTICWCPMGHQCRLIQPFDERMVGWTEEDARQLAQRVMEVNPDADA